MNRRPHPWRKPVTLTVLISAVLVLAIARSSAQDLSVSLGGGAVFPTKPTELADYWAIGPAFAVALEYRVTPVLAIAGRFDYSAFQFDGQKIVNEQGAGGLGIEVTGGTISMILATGNLKFYPFPSAAAVRPYLSLGGGMATFELGRIDISAPGGFFETVDGTAETATLLAFGAGIAIPLSSSFDLFAEGRYTVIFTEEEHAGTFPVMAGLRFNF